jgi:hypothetical protein
LALTEKEAILQWGKMPVGSSQEVPGLASKYCENLHSTVQIFFKNCLISLKEQ